MGTERDAEEAIRPFASILMIVDRYSVSNAILYVSGARGTHRPDRDADAAVLPNSVITDEYCFRKV